MSQDLLQTMGVAKPCFVIGQNSHLNSYIAITYQAVSFACFMTFTFHALNIKDIPENTEII